jgi:hypothetical protein
VRIYLTGASGFVGSNFTYVFGERHGAEVIAPSHDVVDLTDASLVTRSVLATLPDAIVHTAIWNDPAGLMSDRRRAWDAYVGATRNVVDAANRAHAHVVLISTDWVFDGIDAPVNESEPPHQHLRLSQGQFRARGHRACEHRDRGPDRGRPGPPPGSGKPASLTGFGVRLLRRLPRRCAARRTAIHGLGRSAAQPAGYPDAGN